MIQKKKMTPLYYDGVYLVCNDVKVGVHVKLMPGPKVLPIVSIASNEFEKKFQGLWYILNAQHASFFVSMSQPFTQMYWLSNNRCYQLTNVNKKISLFSQCSALF